MISIQQAGCNALASYLAAQIPDVRIEERWPDYSNQLQLPTLTLVQFGYRVDIPADFAMVAQTLVGSNQVTFQQQTAMIEQTIHMEIWAANQFQRDDILARLDASLNVDPATGEPLHGIHLPALSDDNWPNTWFDYYFDAPYLHEEPYTALQEEWRVTINAKIWGMLAITRTTPRQILINFQQSIDGTPFP